jgi:hypothetical protein
MSDFNRGCLSDAILQGHVLTAQLDKDDIFVAIAEDDDQLPIGLAVAHIGFEGTAALAWLTEEEAVQVAEALLDAVRDTRDMRAMRD